MNEPMRKNKKINGKSRGRRNKFEYWITEDGLKLLAAWTRDGYTDEMIAKKIGILRTTIYDWKRKYPTFADALRRGKEIVDIEVENALLKRALGYMYDEVTREAKLNPITGKYEMVETKRVTKEVVADVTAQIYWSKNRKPDSWREKQEVRQEIAVADGTNQAILKMLAERKIES